MIKLYIVPVNPDGSLGKMMASDKYWDSRFPENTGPRIIIQPPHNGEVLFIGKCRGGAVSASDDIEWYVDFYPDTGPGYMMGDFEHITYDKFFDWLLQNRPIEHTFLMFNLDILSGHFTPPDDCDVLSG